jgi:hypothetical protein
MEVPRIMMMMRRRMMMIKTTTNVMQDHRWLVTPASDRVDYVAHKSLAP